jgi:hypothetical protein
MCRTLWSSLPERLDCLGFTSCRESKLRSVNLALNFHPHDSIVKPNPIPLRTRSDISAALSQLVLSC